MNSDFYLMRKSNLLLLFVILVCISLVNAGGGRNTNIVLTKDTIVLNDRHKKHSNNIVIKDGHKNHHHCDCHETHHYVPMHHWGHNEHWDHHKRSDSLNWWDLQTAASDHTLSSFNAHNYYHQTPPIIHGKDNDALNSVLKQRYFGPVKFNLENFENIQLPVFVRQNNLN